MINAHRRFAFYFNRQQSLFTHDCFRLWGVVLVITALIGPGVLAKDQADIELDSYASKHYLIHSNLSKKEARVFGKHMDRIFNAYKKRFQNLGLSVKNNAAMPLFLLRTQEQYATFMSQYQINAVNTGGMFFVRHEIQGLATFTQGRPATETFDILQHEGFHQFAFKYLGANLPIWVNEGLAQYFEDGIFVKGDLKLDLANARRIASIKTAIAEGRDIDFEQMLSMTDEQWSNTLAASPEQANLLYDQAWSMVFFLATAERGRYVEPFKRYLQAMASGTDSMQAFYESFRLTRVEPFHKAWQQYAREAQPDTVNIVLERLNFLGHALRYMKERNMAMPLSTAHLRSQLQKLQYRTLRTTHGITTETSSQDESLYRYPSGRAKRFFKILPPAGDDLPPGITAPGLKPRPTVIWSRDFDGQLMQDVVFH